MHFNKYIQYLFTSHLELYPQHPVKIHSYEINKNIKIIIINSI